MWQDELLRERDVRHLDRAIALAEREIERHREDETMRVLAAFYHHHFLESRHKFSQWEADLISVFRRMRDDGCLELMASAATHGLLPLLEQSPEAVRAQVLLGCDSYREIFQADPAGFWLPECAYYPGLENVLREANLRWFILDAHGLVFGQPRPRRAFYAPCYPPAGPAAFARDRDSSRQVWSAAEGYPGDPAYREFYRDIGFELPPEYLRPEATGAVRKFTGIEYQRITDRHGPTQLYAPGPATRLAQAHAT